MKINREKAREAFADYVKNYNSGDSKIQLKIEHTYRVNKLCEQIAKEIGLKDEDVDLAWLIGLLHDVGRFEQLKKYGTFVDAISIDHAQCGADILFNEDKIRFYIEDSREDELLQTAIRYHSSYRLPEGISARQRTFCNILRDADKIDILKVNIEFPLEEIYNVTTEDLRNAVVSPEVMDSFKEEHATLRKFKKTSVDFVVAHISLVFELVYPISYLIVQKQGYLKQLMNFQSDNPVTREQFQTIGNTMNEYVKNKITKKIFE